MFIAGDAISLQRFNKIGFTEGITLGLNIIKEICYIERSLDGDADGTFERSALQESLGSADGIVLRSSVGFSEGYNDGKLDGSLYVVPLGRDDETALGSSYGSANGIDLRLDE